MREKTMIDLIKSHLKNISSHEEKVNKSREILQLLILKILFQRNLFKNLAFQGGTALRFLYGLRRFSEDLDFSLIDKQGYDFKGLVGGLSYELESYGLKCELEFKDKTPVNHCYIKFVDFFYNLGISSQKGQKLLIKIEIDTNPPDGWNKAFSLINNIFLFTVTTFDISSLFSTKLHACFFRKYAKGRDFYDLIWYLGKKVKPNYVLLNNAIKQTEGFDPKITEENFTDFLREKITHTNFKHLRKDVEVFLEDKAEIKLLDRDLILSILEV